MASRGQRDTHAGQSKLELPRETYEKIEQDQE